MPDSIQVAAVTAGMSSRPDEAGVTTQAHRQLSLRSTLAACLLLSSLLLGSCGGDNSDEEPKATLPASVQLIAPLQAEPDTAVDFKTSLSSAVHGLTIRWSFGDGQSSSEAEPQHLYAKPGHYRVEVSLSDLAGNTRSAGVDLLVGRFGMVDAAACSGTDSTGWCRQGSAEEATSVLSYASATVAWGTRADGQLYRSDVADPTWRKIDTGVPARRIYQVAFANAQTGWALGVAEDPVGVTSSRGVLLIKTIDGGSTWVRQTLTAGWTPSEVERARLQVLDSRRVLLVPDTNSTVLNLVSKDGGASWAQAARREMVFAGQGQASWEIVRDPSAALLLKRSDDLGVTVAEPGFTLPPGPISNLTFVDDQHGWLFQEIYHPPPLQPGYIAGDAVWSTSNGGASWTLRNPLALARRPSHRGPPELSMLDLRNGFTRQDWSALGNQSGVEYARTADGGTTWSWIAAPAGRCLVDMTAVAALEVWTSGSCRPQGVPIVPEPPDSAIYLSADLGVTWRRIVAPQAPSNSPVLAVQRDSSQALLLRYATHTYRSTDDGLSWQETKAWPAELPLPADDSMNAITFKSARIGDAVVSGGQLVSTQDGGKTWLPSGNCCELEPALRTSRTDHRGRLQYAGDRLWLSSSLYLRYRDAGGADLKSLWPVRAIATDYGYLNLPYRDFDFVDADQGWVLDGWSPDVSTVMPWTAAGTSFTSTRIPEFLVRAIRFSDRQHGLAVGAGGGIAQTLDGGGTWTVRASGSTAALHALHFSEPEVAWAVGAKGTVLVSRDAGANWQARDLGMPFDWHSVFFADAKHGWIVGDYGSIVSTRDGGQTWQRQISGTAEHLLDVFAFDAGTAWAISDRGLIFATASGGN